jgi:hypothetical protein
MGNIFNRNKIKTNNVYLKDKLPWARIYDFRTQKIFLKNFKAM